MATFCVFYSLTRSLCPLTSVGRIIQHFVLLEISVFRYNSTSSNNNNTVVVVVVVVAVVVVAAASFGFFVTSLCPEIIPG